MHYRPRCAMVKSTGTCLNETSSNETFVMIKIIAFDGRTDGGRTNKRIKYFLPKCHFRAPYPRFIFLENICEKIFPRLSWLSQTSPICISMFSEQRCNWRRRVCNCVYHKAARERKTNCREEASSHRQRSEKIPSQRTLSNLKECASTNSLC